MSHRTLITATLFVALGIANARAWDDSKYIDLKGQWVRASGGMGRYDPMKPPGRGQEAPLTAEYRAIHEGSIADQATGGQGVDPTYACRQACPASCTPTRRWRSW